MKDKDEKHYNINSGLFSSYPSYKNPEKKMLSNEPNLSDKYSNLSTNNQKTLKHHKTHNIAYLHIFPILYFFSAIILPFVLIVINILQEKLFKIRITKYPLDPFPIFFSLKTIQPYFFSFSILTISLAGFLNVWFFSSILLQRFSVPELRKHKMAIHLMFIIGIFANIIYIFFGFSPELFKMETIKIKNIKISLSLIIFLTFIIFNVLFSVMTIYSLEKLHKHENSDDNKLRKNIRIKTTLVYLSLLVMFIYIMTIILENNINEELTIEGKSWNKNIHKSFQYIVLFFPYILYTLNALMNLSYYYDIIYIQEQMNLIIDKEYFINNEERALFILNY
jgi:hypothetical protein